MGDAWSPVKRNDLNCRFSLPNHAREYLPRAGVPENIRRGFGSDQRGPFRHTVVERGLAAPDESGPAAPRRPPPFPRFQSTDGYSFPPPPALSRLAGPATHKLTM